MKSPRALGLPYDDWRPGQRLAIRTAKHAKTGHVIINAPTGSGKSTIAAALPALDPQRRYVTLTATKALQDQYAGTFTHLRDLRGMSNYDCLAARDEFRDWFGFQRRHVTCEDGPCHDGAKCSLRDDGCLYYDARRDFVASHAGLTNYAAWLSNRRFGEGLGQADVLVLDEAHALPEQLMGAHRITISCGLFDSAPPRSLARWKGWAAEQLERLAPTSDDTRVRRARLEEALKGLMRMDETWAWEQEGESYVFEPTVPKLLLPLLHTFDRRSTLVYLSATITPAMLDLLDVPARDITYLELASTFPVNRRPVYVRTAARVDWRSMQQADVRAAWLGEIDSIIGLRLDRKGLVHPVSFERGYDIYNNSQYKRYMIMHHRGQSARHAVEQYRLAKPPAILISPSIYEGLDFPYQQAEYQILAKVPFPDTRSPIMKARCKATPGYAYSLTLRKIVQTVGRIVRADDDQGETFIVDAHARWLFERVLDDAPRSFREALVTSRRAIRPLPKL